MVTTNKVPVLTGKLVSLSRVSMADADDTYLSWLNDDEVIRGLETVSKPYTMDMLKNYVGQIVASPGTYMFMINDLESGRKIGTVKIHNIHAVNGTCNLGLMIGDKSFWGKGHSQEALHLVIGFAFESLRLRKICDAANADNLGSLFMCKKEGFRIEGELKEHVLSGGKYVDKILLSLFASDWKK